MFLLGFSFGNLNRKFIFFGIMLIVQKEIPTGEDEPNREKIWFPTKDVQS